MNMKTAVAAVCLVLLCSAAVVCISDDSDIDASAMDTITVRNGQELADAIRSTYMMSGNTPVPTPKNIVVADGVDTIVIDDSLVVKGSDGGYVSKYFYGTFDGNGCTLKGELANDAFLIEVIGGTSALKNFHIDVEGAALTLAFYASSATVIFEDIVLDRFVTCGNNTSAFMAHTFASDVTYRDCVNNASYVIETYAGVFLGGYTGENNKSLTFDGCVNNGDILGDRVYMFVGNGAYIGGTITVKDCVNNGTFKGNKAAPFSNFNGLSGSGVDRDHTELNERYTAELGGFSLITLTETVTYHNGTGLITITGADPSRSYRILMAAYATADDGSTYGMSVDIPFVTGGTYAGWFVDKYTAVEKYNLTLGDFPAGHDYPYQMISSGSKTFYVFDFGEDTYRWNMDNRPSLKMKAYDSDGSLLGIKECSSGRLNAPTDYTTTRTVDVPESSCYTVQITSASKGNVVRTGSTMTFTVTPAVGFEIIGVTAYKLVYNSTTEVYDRVDVPVDHSSGAYSCTVDADIYLVIDYEQVYNTVTYVLSNVTSDNMQEAIIPGSSFKARLAPAEGYVLGTIYVTVGGSTYTADSDTVFIPSASGDVMIACIAAPMTADSGSSDDDGDDGSGDYTDDSTVTTTDTSSSDGKTVVVACAAAAVAAAMIAAFLLIDGRKP